MAIDPFYGFYDYTVPSAKKTVSKEITTGISPSTLLAVGSQAVKYATPVITQAAKSVQSMLGAAPATTTMGTIKNVITASSLYTAGSFIAGVPPSSKEVLGTGLAAAGSPLLGALVGAKLLEQSIANKAQSVLNTAKTEAQAISGLMQLYNSAQPSIGITNPVAGGSLASIMYPSSQAITKEPLAIYQEALQGNYNPTKYTFSAVNPLSPTPSGASSIDRVIDTGQQMAEDVGIQITTTVAKGTDMANDLIELAAQNPKTTAALLGTAALAGLAIANKDRISGAISKVKRKVSGKAKKKTTTRKKTATKKKTTKKSKLKFGSPAYRAKYLSTKRKRKIPSSSVYSKKRRLDIGSSAQYSKAGGRTVKYTKNGQPYIIDKATGRARFIEKPAK